MEGKRGKRRKKDKWLIVAKKRVESMSKERLGLVSKRKAKVRNKKTKVSQSMTEFQKQER